MKNISKIYCLVILIILLPISSNLYSQQQSNILTTRYPDIFFTNQLVEDAVRIFENEHHVYSDSFVTRVGKRVAIRSDKPLLDYKFKVVIGGLNSIGTNAFFIISNHPSISDRIANLRELARYLW